MYMKSGDNVLRIKAMEDPARPGTYYVDRMWARFFDGAGQPIDEWQYILRRHPAEVVLRKVPPLARWKWRKGDEGVWVECAAGCCEVAARIKA
jgi:hypothetical protein